MNCVPRPQMLLGTFAAPVPTSTKPSGGLFFKRHWALSKDHWSPYPFPPKPTRTPKGEPDNQESCFITLSSSFSPHYPGSQTRDIDFQTLSPPSDRGQQAVFLCGHMWTHGCACTLAGPGRDLSLIQNSLCLAINPIWLSSSKADRQA